MLPRIESIKQMRQKLGITQKKVADMAQVSTSMINQIESGRTKPSYETARRIFDILAKLEGQKNAIHAGEFCCTDIVIMAPDDTLHDAVKKMHKHSISQIPIFDHNAKVTGLVTEDGIVRHLSDVGESELKKTKIKNMMEPPPPIVDHGTPASVLVPLIRYSKCILISKESKVIGIITASDTLKIME